MTVETRARDAALVLAAAAAAPEVGAALLTVALVCGSTGGSLPVDAAGIGPAGRRPITPYRVAGVLLAIVATAIGALGARGHVKPLLLSLAFAAGLFMAVQPAANGQLARETGEPFVATLVNVALGLVLLGTVAIVAFAMVSLDAPPTNPGLFVGGLLGGFVVAVSRGGRPDARGPAARARDGRGSDDGRAGHRPDRPGAGRGRDRGDGDRRRPHDGRGRDQRARTANGLERTNCPARTNGRALDERWSAGVTLGRDAVRSCPALVMACRAVRAGGTRGAGRDASDSARRRR